MTSGFRAHVFVLGLQRFDGNFFFFPFSFMCEKTVSSIAFHLGWLWIFLKKKKSFAIIFRKKQNCYLDAETGGLHFAQAAEACIIHTSKQGNIASEQHHH